MTNHELLTDMMQAGRILISPIQSQEGAKGLLIEFQPHPDLKGFAPVRIALPEKEARDFHQKLGDALAFRQVNPAQRSGTKN